MQTQNHNGLVAQLATPLAIDQAKHRATFKLSARYARHAITVGTDKDDDAADRKRLKQALSWLNRPQALAQDAFIGQAKLDGLPLLCLATDNLLRTRSQSGRPNARHARVRWW